MKFLRGVLVVFLVTIIVGGLGFIGYITLFTNHSGHNNTTVTANTENTNQSKDTSKDTMANHTGMSQNADNSQQSGNSAGLNQANTILQNKDSLNKSLTALNEAIRLMTVDPYASDSNSDKMGNMQMKDSSQAPVTPMPQGDTKANAQSNPTASGQGGNNTTVNIYPQADANQSTQSTTSQQNNVIMQNMGTVYDANKMEQLHNGVYKMSLGMALLNQLQNQLVSQAENASTNTQDLVQYYTNQYSLTVQNKTKLTQAQNYINEAASLVNINPYISSSGLVYDKERMNQIHQSIYKLAEGVASLNLLSDDLTRQSIILSNTAQTYISNITTAGQMSHTAMSQGVFGGLFSNINIKTIVNTVLVIFVVVLILSILGFIFSQLKSTKKIDQNFKSGRCN
ncbi:hypothetical protein [Pseudobacteroides cellulosolvens]|uniref:Uncharacterized protein n=1 Tax=Pseudobacteroides cellulosolvens ATCC 35603 = DSM 2933 TaxID=398512 RepID=A0A0L6JQG0_9FIRM|nr:hypothetical protein [Pseudobacteroides cellulosolvens]KNY28076.1 hypothetical protein Bccel_3347 [Pseudobacteroides cellulosolvens ATCC 35603 = DSM 2933]